MTNLVLQEAKSETEGLQTSEYLLTSRQAGVRVGLAAGGMRGRGMKKRADHEGGARS